MPIVKVDRIIMMMPVFSDFHHLSSLQVWDPSQLADTSIQSLQHRHKLSPYNDRALAGQVIATFVRGQQVFANGSSLATQSCGRTIAKTSGLVSAQ